MRIGRVRRSILLMLLAGVTAFGGIVPSVFHDSFTQWEDNAKDGVFPLFHIRWEQPYMRNRLTGDVQLGRPRQP